MVCSFYYVFLCLQKFDVQNGESGLGPRGWMGGGSWGWV